MLTPPPGPLTDIQWEEYLRLCAVDTAARAMAGAIGYSNRGEAAEAAELTILVAKRIRRFIENGA